MTSPAKHNPPQPALVAGPPLPPLPSGWSSLGAAFVKAARRVPDRIALADSVGTSLSYRETLLRATALGWLLRRRCPEEFVGVMVPPTAHAGVVNIALTLMGKVPVNLNYSASEQVVNSSIEQCKIKHVITSQRVLDKFKIRPAGELIFLEKLPKEVSKADKVAAFASTKLPRFLLPTILPGLRGGLLDKPATVIFTSGSTAEPKGVVLTHRNVLSNMLQIDKQVHLKDEDCLLGILPFFHSFGFTVTLWTVLGHGLRGVYHISPLDSKIVGHLCEQHGATAVAATPTFVRGYLQRCPPEQFKSLRLLIVGAEKLKPELSAQIESKWGVKALEGYGCTETGPVAITNIPFDIQTADGRTLPGNRVGTVGRPVPGTEARVVEVESRRLLNIGDEGIVEVKGPQVMQGYLNKPEVTANVLRDGWYHTGDLGSIDADGFVRITGRLSRFAKIGGEMVPHHAVEVAISEVCGIDEAAFAVTSVPDAKRGERLVVVHTALKLSPQEIYTRLLGSDLPRLWIPGTGDFVEVEALPILGTGKLDLRRLRELAEAGSAMTPAPSSAT